MRRHYCKHPRTQSSSNLLRYPNSRFSDLRNHVQPFESLYQHAYSSMFADTLDPRIGSNNLLTCSISQTLLNCTSAMSSNRGCVLETKMKGLMLVYGVGRFFVDGSC